MGHRENPDWYRVKYSLAAECFNWAYVGRRQLESIDQEGEDGMTPRQSLEEANREARKLLIAIDECIEAPREDEDRAGERPARDDALDGFLGGHLKPGLLILLGGIEQFARDQRRSKHFKIPYEPSLTEIEEAIRGNEFFVPDVLAELVAAHWKPVPASVSYNLACFYAQRRQDEKARESLWACVEGTPPSEWIRLRREIEADPFIARLAGWLDETVFGRVQLPSGLPVARREERYEH